MCCMEEWKEYKLRDLFLEIKSGDWGKDSPQYEYVESVACLRGADIPSTNKQQISKAPTRYISARNFAAKSLKIGDLVIEISGGSPTQSTGRVAYISQSVLNLYKSRVICSNFCKVLQVNTDVIDSNFAYYLWNYLYKKGIFFSYENGTNGLKNLCLDAFLDYEYVTIPSSLDEQQAIATFLSEIDNKIAVNLRVSSNLEAQAQAIFKHWFIGFAPFKDGKFIESEIGMIPEGWKVGTLGDVLTSIETGNRPPGGAASEGVPSIGAEKIEGICHYDFSSEKYVPREFFKNMRRGKVQSRDVLLYKDGAYTGKSTLFMNDFPYAECAVNEHVFLLRTDESKWQCWLYLYLSYEPIRRYIHTLASAKAAQPGLNQVELKSVKIILPPADVIDRFEATAHSLLSPIIHYLKENRNLSMLRDTLLPKLISGQIKL